MSKGLFVTSSDDGAGTADKGRAAGAEDASRAGAGAAFSAAVEINDRLLLNFGKCVGQFALLIQSKRRFAGSKPVIRIHQAEDLRFRQHLKVALVGWAAGAVTGILCGAIPRALACAAARAAWPWC